jgi:threonyl-tRNA synthetase
MIRNAETQKIPIMSVIGEKELESNSLSVRTRASGELGMIAVAEVLEKIQAAIANHTNF